MPPISSFIHIAMGVLTSISTVAIYISYLKTHSESVRRLVMPFFFLSAYTLSAGIPALFTTDPNNLAWGFFGALFFTFLCILTAYRLPLFSENTSFPNLAKSLMALTTLVAVVSLTLEFFDPTLPTINSNGIIFWHMQPIGAWATAAISLITGIAWGVIFLNSSQYVTDAYSRLKAYVLAADGMTWGLAAFLYFPSYNQVQTLTSFFLMVVSLSVTAVVFTLARLRGSRLSVPE